MYACELSDSMVTMSRDILAANQMADKINVVHAYSTNLSVPRDRPRRYAKTVVK